MIRAKIGTDISSDKTQTVNPQKGKRRKQI
jgi:hypothetical protein